MPYIGQGADSSYFCFQRVACLTLSKVFTVHILFPACTIPYKAYIEQSVYSSYFVSRVDHPVQSLHLAKCLQFIFCFQRVACLTLGKVLTAHILFPAYNTPSTEQGADSSYFVSSV